jgi:hypothetical protein
MSKILAVPVHLDALYLSQSRYTTEPMADFTCLPYFDVALGRDLNPDTPYLSEAILTKPFQDQRLLLKPGIHLHWSLPDALTQAQHQDHEPIFPVVPNRWLITRSRQIAENSFLPEKQWVVESDFLSEENPGSVSYPYIPEQMSSTGSGRPFRYLGRKITLEAWQAATEDGSYLTQLTAVGYGEPTFAAFYPNCHSVFGFHDGDYDAQSLPKELRYDIVGWYSTLEQDELHRKLTGVAEGRSWQTAIKEVFGWVQKEYDLNLLSLPSADDLPTAGKGLVIVAKIGNFYHVRIFDWIEKRVADLGNGEFVPEEMLSQQLERVLDTQSIDNQTKSELVKKIILITLPPPLQPERMLCYGQITFAPLSDTNLTHPSLTNPETGVSVGNTATEALAAHLSSYFEKEMKPDDLEDLLEALQLADHLAQKRLDVGPKFQEGRHENTFRPLSSGKLWTIRRQDDNSQGADVSLAQQREELYLSPDLAQTLDQLNCLQSAYDRAQQQLDDLRAQTFADWYKYMVCVYPPETSRDSYPDIDEIKYFIETKDILPLRNLDDATGIFILDKDGNVQHPDGSGDTLAHQLKQAYDAVKQLLEVGYDFYLLAIAKLLNNQYFRLLDFHFHTLIQQHLLKKDKMVLKDIAPPRYYLPKEPVVLLTGDAATPSDRHGQDGRLHPEGLVECLTIEIAADNAFATRASIKEVREAVVFLFANLPESESIGINIWQHQPWHPIILQWEVEFFPTRDGNNLNAENRRYQPNFIDQNYELAEKDVELRIKPEKIPPDKTADVYSGTTILSPTARPVLSEQILIYLEKYLLSDYYTTHKIPEAQQTEDYFSTHLSTILDWYKANGSNKNFKTLIGIYEHLQANSGSNLSQSLGGFNDALLMHKVTLQTPIADPIGFEKYRTFTERDVCQAVGQRSIRAPQPLADFNPIRAGALKLLRLRLIDNFGIVHDVNVDNMTTTRQLRLEDHPDWVAMLPRLAQPARVNFRWLAADRGSQETNSLVDTTPICGWLLPNNLDDSLAVYDRNGRALGSLYALQDTDNHSLAQWRSAPGREQPIQIPDISNPHLRKVVEYVQQKGRVFVGNFLQAIDTALAGIDPESAAQHDSLALLMGRPIAVVRASVNLELMGFPALNQSWNVFRQDLRRSRRETDGFTQVVFPIRIGEYHQLNDGLVGYWLEDSAFQIHCPFYAAQSDPNDSADIITYYDSPIAIKQTIDAPPQYLTMLVDPRGVIHATSGILPTKEISIPANQYRDALRNIEVTFFSAPILSDANQLDLSLPREAGYLWSWLQRVNDNWTEISTLQTVPRSAFIEAMSNDLWESLIQQGWLTVLDEETALVVAVDQRPPLNPNLESQRAKIEQILEHPTIDPARLQAHFLSQPTVREGWLKLRKMPDANA